MSSQITGFGLSQSQSSGGSPVPELLRGYRRLDGAADELFDEDGQMRAVWRGFIDHLSGLDKAGLDARFLRGNQYLRDAGVFYRKYGENSAAERDWPLSPIPVMIAEADWSRIATGLSQRADLLEQVVADLYGPNKLVRDGYLPASLVAQNPGWLRPQVGIRPPGGHFLNFIAFEVGRGPSGQWWVLRDRTDAPSGAGFALENRVATSRVFPNFYSAAHVHRLAGFFRDFRATLLGMRRDCSEPVGLLTPGQMNDGYFEHAYLARYLGLLLVEGEDLAVVGGTLQVRTVEGLRPISVLWRRMDAEFCDPLELNETSALGTAGLLGAVREGALSTVNALGAGVLESRALMAFLPKIAHVLTGGPLALPNVATWWCGAATERDVVFSRRKQMVLRRAMAGRWPHDRTPLPRIDDPKLDTILAAQGAGLVGQERMTLSTAPYWQQDALVPRPMSLRVFLARTASGWQVLPGGYARIATAHDPDASDDKLLAMQAGGSVSDVWVVSPTPVPKPTLLSTNRTQSAGQYDTALPSRAADNLFWLGRYIERAETAMRVFRAYFGLRATGLAESASLAQLIQTDLLFSATSDAQTMAAQFEAPLDGAVLCAKRIRDRFSVDGILALKELSMTARGFSNADIPYEETADKVGTLLRQISGFAGLVHENMYHSTGWRFLSLGTSLERAVGMATVLARLLCEDAPEGSDDLALELGDSFMSHRARYTNPPSPASLIDLLALDNRNPRSIHYQLKRLQTHIDALPLPAEHIGEGPHIVAAQAAQLLHLLGAQSANELGPEGLLKLRKQIWNLSDALSKACLK